MRFSIFIIALAALISWSEARRPKRFRSEGDDMVGLDGISSYNTLTSPMYRWPNKTLIYEFAADNTHTPAQRAMYYKAMDIIASVSCIRFKQRTDEVNYVSLQNNKPETCSSNLGYLSNGKQNLWIGWCINVQYSIVHEFMHSLGFHHEQTRYDRDLYLEMQWDNIPADWRHNYRKFPRPSAFPKWTYDVMSVLQYGVGNPPRMVLRDGGDQENGKLGQRERLNPSDILRMRAAYSCDSSGAETRSAKLSPEQQRIAEYIAF